MQTYKIVKIYRNPNKKNGEPWVSQRSGKPMVKISMALEGIDGYVSFFDDSNAFGHLKQGDTLEGEVSINGQYKDFRPATNRSQPQGTASADMMKKLDEINGKLDKLLSNQQNTTLPDNSEDDLPF